MAENSQQSFFEQYAPIAMEQMRLYGIPASVTLAQAALESAHGQSTLAQRENNFFGMKGTYNGNYGVYSDDKPNEKFKSYPSVEVSFQDHSMVLKNNSRYSDLFELSALDYKGWANGLKQDGYATDPRYAQKLISTIENNDLSKYDQMVMSNFQTQGLTPGQALQPNGLYSFPLDREKQGFLVVTSPFGNREAPVAGASTNHTGIDLAANVGEDVFSSENNGKVVAVNQSASDKAGKYVTVEYARDDGERIRCTYAHLNYIDVQVGQTVQAGEKIGEAGQTGNVTGPHLHYAVKTATKGSDNFRSIDPAVYLAEIGQKGNISTQAMYNGEDLLAQYRPATQAASPELAKVQEAMETNLSPEAWIEKLLSSEDSGFNQNSADPLVEMIMTIFLQLLAMANAIDDLSSDKEKNANITQAITTGKINLTPLVESMEECSIGVNNEGKTVLSANTGEVQVSKELTPSELGRLSAIVNNSDMDEETKRQSLSSFITGVVYTQQASQNYEEQRAMSTSQDQTLKR